MSGLILPPGVKVEKQHKSYVVDSEGEIQEVQEVKKNKVFKADNKMKIFDESAESTQLLDESWRDRYLTGEVIRPPYDPYKLRQFLEDSVFHLRSVKQKAIDVCCLGWDILPIDPLQPKEGTNYKTLVDFFTEANPDIELVEVLENAWVDYESIGWQCIEMTRNKAKKPYAFYHVPSYTMRKAVKDHVHWGYIQRRFNSKGILIAERHFKKLGDMEERIDPNTGKPMNEMIWMDNYSTLNDWYGVPEWIPAIGAMIGNNEARDYNIAFFANGAIPQYAIIMEGGEVTPEVRNIIKKHFRDLKGTQNSHRTLILECPEGGKIHLIPLAVEVRDGHFRLYRKDNRDEVLVAHGMPPYRIGIAETGSLGSNVSENATVVYKNSVVTPRQVKLEHRLKRLIKKCFGIYDFYLKFAEIDIDDKKLKAEIDEIESKAAKNWVDSRIYTPNEIRKQRGSGPLPGGDEFPSDTPPIQNGTEKIDNKDDQNKEKKKVIKRGSEDWNKKFNVS